MRFLLALLTAQSILDSMNVSPRRAWEGAEWQSYALKLVQLRHGGGQNVQPVPDQVKGDAGLEFFTPDGCVYQCYAPEEVSDTQKAASAMKAKGRRDLSKLIKNQAIIQKILQHVKIKRWILLCPFLDDKEVVGSVREKAAEVAAAGLAFLDVDFQAFVHSQEDFEVEAETLRKQSLGPNLVVINPEPSIVAAATSSNPLSRTLSEKLSRAFPSLSATEIAAKRAQYIKGHMVRENVLEQMRQDHPILWERSSACLAAEEDLLVAAGLTASIPREQLIESIERVRTSLEKDMQGLTRAVLANIAIGTVGDWLMRCPLDFE